MNMMLATCLILARVTLSQLLGSNVLDHASWEGNRPLGFALTEARTRPGGIEVKFKTDLPPPYVVAEYTAAASGYASQPYPIVCVTTETHYAFIETDAHRYLTTFLKVGTPEGMGIVETYKPEHLEADIARALSGKGFGLMDGETMAEFVRQDTGMEIVADGTWMRFCNVNEPGMEFRISGVKPANELADWHMDTDSVQSYVRAVWSYWEDKTTGDRTDFSTNVIRVLDVHYSASKSEFDIRSTGVSAETETHNYVTNVVDMTLGDVHDWTRPVNHPIQGTYDWMPFPTNVDWSVGTGFRLIFFEDDESILLQRCYSMRTNVSNLVFIQPPMKSLTRHGDRIFGQDWAGTRRFYQETNAVPGRIYWEGLHR